MVTEGNSCSDSLWDHGQPNPNEGRCEAERDLCGRALCATHRHQSPSQCPSCVPEQTKQSGSPARWEAVAASSKAPQPSKLARSMSGVDRWGLLRGRHATKGATHIWAKTPWAKWLEPKWLQKKRIIFYSDEVHRCYQNNIFVTERKVGEIMDDFWNVDGERELSDAWTELSDAWTGFTRFILLNERPPEGYTWSGWRLTRKQTTSRPDNVWPDIWKHMSDAAKSKTQQKWAIEKPKLDHARQLRGIFFIEPDNEEFRHIIKNARRR